MELLKNEESDDKKVEKKIAVEHIAKDSKEPIPVRESKEGKKQFLLQEDGGI